MSWPALVAQWTLIEYAFARYLQIDLERAVRRRTRTGRWFTTRLRGLLSDDTVLAAKFRPTPDGAQPEEQS